jgi:hypothetical protein
MMEETLATLEGRDLGEAEYDSYLVTTCHRLWQTPLDEFGAEEYRIMIGQGLGLAHLMPRALALLADHPLAGGDFYPGDLLLSVLRAEQWIWDREPQLLYRAIAVAEAGLARMNKRFRKDYEDVYQDVLRALDSLRSWQKGRQPGNPAARVQTAARSHGQSDCQSG